MEIIIKNANIAALLDGADKILQRFGKEGVPENIKGQATLSTLKEMFGSSWKSSFSVCDVRKLAEMNDVLIDTEHQQLFDTLHCVKWENMHPDTRAYVQALLVDYFRGNISMAYVGETDFDSI